MKVLLATDGTKYAEAAVEMMRTLRLAAGDSIKVVCIVDMAVPLAIDVYGGYIPETSEMERAARENAERVVLSTAEKLKTLVPEGADVGISTEILFGSPDSRIVETAEEIGADLIVIGSHGYNAWERLLLGSVSNSVVHHAPCSVLIVRSAKDA